MIVDPAEEPVAIRGPREVARAEEQQRDSRAEGLDGAEGVRGAGVAIGTCARGVDDFVMIRYN